MGNIIHVACTGSATDTNMHPLILGDRVVMRYPTEIPGLHRDVQCEVIGFEGATVKVRAV